jgi:hypothetical protein
MFLWAIWQRFFGQPKAPEAKRYVPPSLLSEFVFYGGARSFPPRTGYACQVNLKISDAWSIRTSFDGLVEFDKPVSGSSVLFMMGERDFEERREAILGKSFDLCEGPRVVGRVNLKGEIK